MVDVLLLPLKWTKLILAAFVTLLNWTGGADGARSWAGRPSRNANSGTASWRHAKTTTSRIPCGRRRECGLSLDSLGASTSKPSKHVALHVALHKESQ